MSAEGIGTLLVGCSLFITLIGIVMAGGRAYGTLHEQSETTRNYLAKLLDDNHTEHEKIFDCLKEVNGTVREHSIEIQNLKEKTKGL